MPFFLLSALGGAGIAYALIESGYAIEALCLFVVFILLLYIAPATAFWFLGAIIALSILAAMIAYWEFVAALVLGFALFVFLVGGLLHAVEVLAK